MLFLTSSESIEAQFCEELEQVWLQLKTKDEFAQVYGILYLWFSIAVELVIIPHKVKLQKIHLMLNKGKIYTSIFSLLFY